MPAMEVWLTVYQLAFLVVNWQHFYELSQWFDLEAALQTNDVTESDVKEVIKKLLESAPRQKGGEKVANDANNKINTTNVD